MEHFKSLVETSSTQPQSQSAKASSRSGYFFTFIKDQLTTSSWLALGACLNAILFLAIGRIALALPFILLGYRFGDALLQTWGFKQNPYMEGQIMKKYSAQLPNPDGTFGPKAANQQIVVFMIGARCNHPMGLLGPGFKELGDYFQSMQKDVEANAAKYDFLGGSDWTAAGERSTSNHLLSVMYFKSSEGLHAFAHDELHRKGWNWYNKHIKDYPHLSIYHELYVVPKGHWESIYVNSEPMLLGAATVPLKGEDGQTKWVSPIVDATKGVLKSSKGRMTLTNGNDNDGYGYENYEYSEKAQAHSKG